MKSGREKSLAGKIQLRFVACADTSKHSHSEVRD